MNGAKIGDVLRRSAAALACVCCLAACSSQRPVPKSPDPLAALDRSVAAAEESLRIGERQVADSRYRTILLEGWMILGAIAASDGQLAEARRAFERASSSAVDSDVALRSLAIVQLQMGDTSPALEVLTQLAAQRRGTSRCA